MAITNYYTLNRRILAEDHVGVTGTRNYGADALGTVTSTYDSSGLLQNTYRCRPYGSGSPIKTGVGADAPFIWNGGNGYRSAPLQKQSYYVRLRTLFSDAAAWYITDPEWPSEPP